MSSWLPNPEKRVGWDRVYNPPTEHREPTDPTRHSTVDGAR